MHPATMFSLMNSCTARRGRLWHPVGALRLIIMVIRVSMVAAVLMGALCGPAARAQEPTPTPVPDVQSSPDFLALTDKIEGLLRDYKFIAGTARQGSVFVQDIRTGNILEVNPGVTYSGVSVTKIAVMLTFYAALADQGRATPTRDEAILLAKMMLCSDNDAANALLDYLDGLSADGQYGLNYNTWRFSQSTIDFSGRFSNDGTPSVTDGPVVPDNADSDPTNAFGPDKMGGVLAQIAKCAGDPTFGPPYRSPDCRRMLALMRANQIGALIEGGVPEGTWVAHKQGWDEDTHADAAHIITPGGSYVLVIMLHQRKFLNYQGSFPLMAEVSRAVYNAYNPTAPLRAIRSAPIPVKCVIPNDVIAMLTADQPPDLALP